jgi:hypothetical protein
MPITVREGAFSVYQIDTSRVCDDPTLCRGTRVGLTLRVICDGGTATVRECREIPHKSHPMHCMGWLAVMT